jgi:hypothetical protein
MILAASGKVVQADRIPGFTVLTSPPICSTTPATSWPNFIGSGSTLEIPAR